MKTLIVLAIVLAGRGPASAQTLPLRRDVPAPTPGGCPAEASFTLPTISSVDRQAAAQLATEASNAAILGDHRSARDLLARAAAIDPTAPSIAFRFGRTLEELSDHERAVLQYCRYLELAGSAPDADDVRRAIDRIAPAQRMGIPDSAVERFHTALTFADSADHAAAEQAFTAVIAAAPTWPAPYYNRGLIRAATLRHEMAVADFQAFLEREPAAAAHETVRAWMTQLAAPPAPRYDTGTAFVAGLLPGGGHFYTGRTAPGLLVLASAGGAIAFGMLSEAHHVECLTVPQGGSCPPDQVLEERIERPYLLASIGAAAALSLLGAIDAVRGARRKNAAVPRIILGAHSADDGPHLLGPTIQSTSHGARLDLALIRLRF